MNKQKEKTNWAFFGTPDLCIPILDELKKADYLPKVVVTMPDRPVGRKQTMTPPPVKVWAQDHGIPVLQPEKLNTEELKAFDLDLSIVVAYGKIIPEAVINLPKKGTLNIHYSLLPKWRGASPVEAVILAGEKKTGVCIQKMAKELDAGAVIACEEVSVDEMETAVELRDRLNVIGARLLVRVLPDWLSGKLIHKEQNHGQATFCKKITRAEGEVNLEKMTDEELWRRYRAYFGWPGIFYFKDNKRIKITKAKFEDDKFVTLKILPEGKKEIDY